MSGDLEYFNVLINDEFWSRKLNVNLFSAIFHQYDMLEKTHCIDNFRIIAENKRIFREGFYFADSDAYKWLDAACRIIKSANSEMNKENKDSEIEEKLKDLERISVNFASLIEKAQEPDGYIYTFNQIHFPNTRWKNLFIEHELYCIGHLIEAAISWAQAFPPDQYPDYPDLIAVARKAADLIVRDFTGKDASWVPGHQEIELALIKLGLFLKEESYISLAENLLERRGTLPKTKYMKIFIKSSFSTALRMYKIRRMKKKFYRTYSELECKDFKLPPGVKIKIPRGLGRKFFGMVLSGREFQLHRPIWEQKSPEGHSVRFTYQQTAATMLCALRPQMEIEKSVKTSWDRMVLYKMFNSGGIGQLPLIEGFSGDYKLDPFIAYCETCAALGSIFWSWELINLDIKRGNLDAKYADLMEWQLYNASLVSMSEDGTAYFYRNPLATDEPYPRMEWYNVPCCPSNISRTWGSLGKYIYSLDFKRDGMGDESEPVLYIHQYIGNKTYFKQFGIHVEIKSELPGSGNVKIILSKLQQKTGERSTYPPDLIIRLRIPGWTIKDKVLIKKNSEKGENELRGYEKVIISENSPTASGFSPYLSEYAELRAELGTERREVIDIEFPMPIRLLKIHEKVPKYANKAAITRGPLLYCAEECDNPQIKLDRMPAITTDIREILISQSNDSGNSPEDFYEINILKTSSVAEIPLIKAKLEDGSWLRLVPYFYWANRKPGKMQTLFKIKPD